MESLIRQKIDYNFSASLLLISISFFNFTELLQIVRLVKSRIIRYDNIDLFNPKEFILIKDIWHLGKNDFESQGIC